MTIVRAPDGELFEGRMTSPRPTRRDGDLVVVRFDDEALAERFAVAVSPRGLSWDDATDPHGARRVMLYRVSGDRPAAAEVRRVQVPQRRDALFKADLVEPGAGGGVGPDAGRAAEPGVGGATPTAPDESA
ncbi:hypothetical protein [Marisediminicola sp. LYQ134]|uniref:hypothetical protein n=1 Tax=Marisediminicola sp. LYQ134 TaxID=3391061 RepID=UPI003983777E